MAVDPLPPCDKFEPVKPTKLVTDFVSLHTVDLATYDDGPEARQLLANAVHDAMTTQGFFYLVNHGLSEESISRQVDIGHHILKNTPGEEKEALRAPIVEEGSYHGFKPRGHWRTTGNVRDKVENYVSRDMTRRQQPQSMKPFQPEIQKFTDYTHKELLYKLLHLFGIALKLDDEYLLINLHSYERHDETWLRYMKYYDDYTEEEKKQTGGLWLIGHQDFTSLSILFSQVRDYESTDWKYVKHLPGAVIVKAGEIMMWWTGNYFKAAIHCVFQPPEDQRGRERCSVFYFCVPNDGVVNNTLLDQSPVLREAGVTMAHEPEKAPTSKEWSNGRIAITGRNAVWDKQGQGTSVVTEQVGKVTTRWFR